MAAYQGWGPDLTGDGDPESLNGLIVSGNFFDVLGARPALGRVLTMRDDDPGMETVVVISDGLWRRRFGADSSILGRRITLSGLPATVIGVLEQASARPRRRRWTSTARLVDRPTVSVAEDASCCG